MKAVDELKIAIKQISLQRKVPIFSFFMVQQHSIFCKINTLIDETCFVPKP
jgi:hypothetical protein